MDKPDIVAMNTLLFQGYNLIKHPCWVKPPSRIWAEKLALTILPQSVNTWAVTLLPQKVTSSIWINPRVKFGFSISVRHGRDGGMTIWLALLPKDQAAVVE